MDRKKGLDFVRAFGALGVIAFHFYCHSSSSLQLVYNHANGSWGTVLNELFFILSGFLVHSKYKNADTNNWIGFYYKRWKAMMPAYVIVFAFAYILKVFESGKFFYLDIPKASLLLSFIGMDGYFCWITPTYLITGEWFLGAIWFAYLLYPLLRLLMARSKLIVLAVMLGIYALSFRVDFFGFPQEVTPAVFLLSFYLGMLLASRPEALDNNRVVIGAAVLVMLMLVVPLPGDRLTKEILMGILLLISLKKIGDILCKNDKINKVVSCVAGLSYYMFLLHHQLIYKILEGFDSVSTCYSVGVLIMVITVTLIFSHVLSLVMKATFSSKLYCRLEAALVRYM